MSSNLERKLATQSARTESDFTWLKGFLDSIHSYAPAETLILQSKDVTDLYHYTDLAGFKGIVDTGDLWLTHLRFSNDNEELTHGIEVVSRKLEERLKNDSLERQGYLQRLKELLDQPVADGVYICCFCQSNNLLSQWRGYGANGSGV